jgi:hypothetical protein
MQSGASEQPDRESRRSGADIRAVRTREAKQSADDPGERIEEIVSSVERATGEIRREAEKEAGRYLQNRRREADELLASHRELLAGLAAGLEEAAEALRAELTRSARTIEEAAARLRTAAEEGRRPTQAPERSSGSSSRGTTRRRQARGEGGTATQAPPRGREQRNSERRSKQDAVMLRATELAIAGRRREEIAAVLKSELDVSDPNKVLDRILGHGY